MNRAIYLNNFRGFKKTYINLADVNFLVGENSSGKTSVLALLNRFLSEMFWFDLDFNSQKSVFGSFGDLVSAESENKKYFTIASCFSEDKESSVNKSFLNGVVLTFIEFNGQTVPNKITLYDNNQIIHGVIERHKLKYVTSRLNSFSGASPTKTLQKLVKYHEGNVDKLVEAELPGGIKNVLGNLPFVAIKEILERNVKRLKQSASVTVKMGSQADSFWLGPIREAPKRFYDVIKPGVEPDGGHIPYVLNEIFNRSKTKKVKNSLLLALNKFGFESGLFSNLNVEKFGKDKNSPFALKVALRKKEFKISSVGYGVSQVLPVIAEAWLHHKKTIFLMQQPEVHLHPRAQAALGTFFFQIAKKDSKKFLIETHSDFLIDRFRLEMKKSDQKVSAQVLYFEKTKNGNICQAVKIEENGKFSSEQPKNFQDFFIREQLELLSI